MTDLSNRKPETGAFFSVSVIGIVSGSPYTAQVLEKTKR